MSSPNERTVVLPEVPDGKAAEIFDKEPRAIPAGHIRQAIPDFKQVSDFTAFLAEYAMIEGDLVIHFFETEERPAKDRHYWLTIFANVLNDEGQAYFQATAPRLVAKYTEEMNSWFFKAQSYGHVINLDVFVMNFLERLDAKLDSYVKEAQTEQSR